MKNFAVAYTGFNPTPFIAFMSHREKRRVRERERVKLLAVLAERGMGINFNGARKASVFLFYS
jgi:hypothetical protein